VTKRDRVDPNRPHAFRDSDHGIAAVMSGSAFETNQANVLAGTTAFLRSTRCAVSGCGRTRQDSIHGGDEAEWEAASHPNG
jgi:hypothetical protein